MPRLIFPGNAKEARYPEVALQELAEYLRTKRASILLRKSHDSLLKLLQEDIDDNLAFLLEEAFG